MTTWRHLDVEHGDGHVLEEVQRALDLLLASLDGVAEHGVVEEDDHQGDKDAVEHSTLEVHQIEDDVLFHLQHTLDTLQSLEQVAVEALYDEGEVCVRFQKCSLAWIQSYWTVLRAVARAPEEVAPFIGQVARQHTLARVVEGEQQSVQPVHQHLRSRRDGAEVSRGVVLPPGAASRVHEVVVVDSPQSLIRASGHSQRTSQAHSIVSSPELLKRP
mmetsp:Transcript_17447/g.48207  ORF Transcript_17447/g.48207 Transcript_17447/m.48207 type:complete len:216 (+) Transcript_17447:697-1344(+)